MRAEESVLPTEARAIVESWKIPGTPLKPICEDATYNLLCQENFIEPGFSQEHLEIQPDCASFKDSTDACSTAGSSIFDSVELFSDIPCTKLLALAEALPRKTFGLGISSLLANNEGSFGSNFQIDGNQEPVTPMCHPHHSFDLNSPPTTITEAYLSTGNSTQFAPVTPDKSNSGERANQAIDGQQNGVSDKSIEGANLEEQTSAAISTQMEENQNPDKGDDEGTNMTRMPQQKPRRRKHRPKVVIEGQPKRTRIRNPNTPKPVTPATETSTGKRKYVRRKGVGKPEEASETIGPKTEKRTRRSCRKQINFDTETQVADKVSNVSQDENLNAGDQLTAQGVDVMVENLVGDKGSFSNQGENLHTSHQSTAQGVDVVVENPAVDEGFSGTQCEILYTGHQSAAQGVDLMVEKSQSDITCDLTLSLNQMPEECLSMPEKEGLNLLVPTTCHVQPIDSDKSAGTSAKCRINFFDETHDEGMNTVPNPNYSNCSTSAFSEKGKEGRGLKRARSKTFDEMVGISSLNEKGAYFNSLEKYLSIFTNYNYVDLPVISKKEKTYKEHCVDALNESSSLAAVAQDKQASVTMMDCSCEQIKRKRTKSVAHVYNISSSATNLESSQCTHHLNTGPSVMEGLEASSQHKLCMKDFAADTHKSKNKTRRTRNVSSVNPNLVSCHQLVPYPTGPHKAYMWRSTDPFELLIRQFENLHISEAYGQVAKQARCALVPYSARYTKQNALVLYQRDGTIVPFGGSVPEKRKKPRPKVDLDEETTRVWNLLLKDINSEGIDGTDEEKAKWWEEERRVFCGRADSFIARMHLVQGDRRFSRWKGSVVDSVVGVFLTQNVSDHLSSSAFMSLAARFPLKSEGTSGSPCEDGTSTSITEPEMCEVSPDELNRWCEDSNQPADKQSFVTLHDEQNEVMKSNELFNYSTGTSKELPEDQRDIEDVNSSQNSVVSSQNSVDSLSPQTTERSPELNICREPTSFVELLKLQETNMLQAVFNQGNWSDQKKLGKDNYPTQGPNQTICGGRDNIPVRDIPPGIKSSDLSKEESRSSNNQKYDGKCATEQSEVTQIFSSQRASRNPSNVRKQAMESNSLMQQITDIPSFSDETSDVTESTTMMWNSRKTEVMGHRVVESVLNDKVGRSSLIKNSNEGNSKVKGGKVEKAKQIVVEWDNLRKQAQMNGKIREKTPATMDSLDYEAVRCAHVDKIADAIKERGMHNVLGQKIKDFLNRLVRDHGSIDLEWLRDVPPDKAKEYLLSFRGLGLKSVECVRLLTLHNLAFPVDTNVGRIAVRLGWVPLQPLPESLQLHLLELYPVLESIQQYLWPRLCKLDQKTLYELHYQMITFGKVFCTKSKPNCNACPMRGECRHFASAFASARLALPATEDKSIVSKCTRESNANIKNPTRTVEGPQLSLPPAIHRMENQLVSRSCEPATIHQMENQLVSRSCEPVIEEPASPEPTVDLPATPGPEQIQYQEDIEDFTYKDPEEIPTIKLNIEEFTQTLQNYMQKNMELQEGDMSRALVALTPEAASIPTPKLKYASRLRTEHCVYELPDSHPLLEGLDKREPDDPCSYLLAIWTPGETANSVQPPRGQCSSQETGVLCDTETCFSCNSIREANSQSVRGTLLIPCRTAMRGSFPLNGTYFQVNEVFADHDSSQNPIYVPRSWIWNLPRRTVFFGTSIPTIFKGLRTEEIQYCFWRGFVCVRGFDQKTRAPRPLIARLHMPASKLPNKGKNVES